MAPGCGWSAPGPQPILPIQQQYMPIVKGLDGEAVAGGVDAGSLAAAGGMAAL